MITRKPWAYSLPAALLLMVPFDLLASLGMDIYLPVVPRMPEFLETTPSTIQLTLSLYMLVLGCGQLVFGPLSDRLGRRPVLLGGAILFAAASLVLASTSSASLFVAFRVVQAAGAAATLVATFATVRDVYGGHEKIASIYGLFGAILAFVPAFGPVLGAVIEQVSGWRSIFLLLAISGGLAGLHALLRWPETRSTAHRTVRLAHVGDILTNAQFWIYALGSSAAYGAFFVFFSTASLVLVNRAGLSPTAFSLMFGTVALVMMATSRFIGRLVTRWGERGCLVRGMLLLLIGSILLSLGQVLMLSSAWGFIGPMWLIAVGISLAASVAYNGALRPFDHVAGTATAILSFVESLIISSAGTLAVLSLPADTAWPLACFCLVLALVTTGLAGKLAAR